MSNDFRDRYAIVGVGVTPTAREHGGGMSAMMLEAWAAKLAIADAGLRREDIDGAVHSMVGAPHPPAQWVDTYARTLGLKPNFYLNAARGGGAAINGILLATQTIATGNADYVLVTCGLPGWSASHRDVTKITAAGATAAGHVMPAGLGWGSSLEFGLNALGFSAGATSTIHGMFASRHMHEYGTKPEQLGEVAIAARAWAQLNPDARFYGRPATMDDYMASPYINNPLRRMDCAIVCDLGVAFVVTSAERAQSLKQTPVYIKGIGLGDQGREQWWNKTNYTQVDGGFALRKALRTAGLSIKDIDVMELYDCFTMEVLMYLEDYGFCEKGEGGSFVEGGRLGPGGDLPVNTHGGQLSGQYLFDMAAAAEAVTQLRWAAGERQVPGAEVALTNGHGGEQTRPMMCAYHGVMLLGRELS